MIYLWVDDERPAPADLFTRDDDLYITNTVNDAIKVIRKEYKAGNTHFLLDLDHDAGDFFDQGGDYINILRYLEDMRRMGHIRNMQVQVKIHTGNNVGRQNMRNIIEVNRDWMKEIL